MLATPLRRPNGTTAKRQSHWTAGAFLAGSLLLILFAPCLAVAQTCPIDQVTFTTGDPDFPDLSGGASISLDGLSIAFQSQAEPVPGSNPNGNFEIWLYDVLGDSLLQITDTASGQNVRPAISGDGLWVVFEGVAELVPGAKDEIVVYDVAGASILQITDTLSGSSLFPGINGDGTVISFRSNADIVAGGNPDGNNELFLYNRTTSTFTQVTTTVGGHASTSSLDGAGNLIAFNSTSDIVGGNPDGSPEIFLYDVLIAATTQITSNVGGAGSFATDLSDDGAWIGLQSDRDLVPGGNLDGSLEVYLYHIPSATFTQVTNLTGPDESFSASIDHDGTKVAFASFNDPVGGNPDRNNELFLYDVPTGEITQITDTTEPTLLFWIMDVSISGNGGRIAFHSFADVTGDNPDGQGEVYLADCETEPLGPIAIPVASGWGLVVFMVLTVLAAAGALRKTA